jgi:uncharacterized protein YhbP (UPF0306 family)
MSEYTTYKDKALHIIKHNKYMVLATADRDKKPWTAVVFYAYDADYNFYFLSAIDSLHAKNILKNHAVAFAIYDSTQKIGQSEGVQAGGRAYEVGRDDAKRVIGIYAKRLFPSSDMPATKRYTPEEYSKPAEFRFFKIVTDRLFTTGEDRRVEIDFKNE